MENSLKTLRIDLRTRLERMDKEEFKLFFSILTHYWVKLKAFISSQSFVNLWCELNLICSDVDEGFPDPYDRELIKSYCQEHPFYFIDILDLRLVIKLFCANLDDRLDVLIKVLDKLDTDGLWAAYACCNEALGMSENIEELVQLTEEKIKRFS